MRICFHLSLHIGFVATRYADICGYASEFSDFQELLLHGVCSHKAFIGILIFNYYLISFTWLIQLNTGTYWYSHCAKMVYEAAYLDSNLIVYNNSKMNISEQMTNTLWVWVLVLPFSNNFSRKPGLSKQSKYFKRKHLVFILYVYLCALITLWVIYLTMSQDLNLVCTEAVTTYFCRQRVPF